MFRSQLPRNATRLLLRASRPSCKRCYSQQYNRTYFSIPPVRALGSTLWVLTAASTIYLSCAAYEVHQDITAFKKHYQGPVTYNTINDKRTQTGQSESIATRSFTFKEVFNYPWSALNSAEKALTTAGALNTSIFFLTFLSPSTFMLFAHVPSSARNFTLFTSMFGHAGPLHLFFNMYALGSFGPSLAGSPTFQSSGSHLTAFYLSSGLLASLAYHMTTIWPKTAHRSIPALGASGAIMAMLGAWAMNYPDSRIGIILVPGSLPAEQALGYLAAFETYGAFIGFRGFLSFLSWGHAAHLGGLAAGVAYVYFDGKERVWQPARRLAFKSMQSAGLV